jgi:hypothetical protein
MRRLNWPVVLALLFVALLVVYLLNTQRIVNAMRADAATLAGIYSQLNQALLDPRPEVAEDALIRLQLAVVQSGIPMVMTGPGDTVLSVENVTPILALPRARRSSGRTCGLSTSAIRPSATRRYSSCISATPRR